MNHYDAFGNFIESGWDFFNVATGVVSLTANISAGNVGGALLDVAGLTYDVLATAVPGLPGGASSAIKAGRAARYGNYIIKSMKLATRGFGGKLSRIAIGSKDKLKLLRYAVVKGVDEAHHIIPHTGPPKFWHGGALRKAMDCLRSRAKTAGVKLEEAMNGVAIRKGLHRFDAKNTLKPEYYQRVIDHFENAEEYDDFIRLLDDLAEQLLRESGKL